MPYTDVYALEACLSVISSARGQEVYLIAPIYTLANSELLFPIIDELKASSKFKSPMSLRTQEALYLPEARP